MNRKKIFLLTTSLFFILSTNAFADSRTLNGMLIGGGIGALTGQAIGGNAESTIFGTAAGSVIGLAIGSSRDSHHHYVPAQRHYAPAPRGLKQYRSGHRPVVYVPVRGPAHYAPRHERSNPHYNHSRDPRRRDNHRW